MVSVHIPFSVPTRSHWSAAVAAHISGLKGLLDSTLLQRVKGEGLDIIEVQRLHLIINRT